MMMASLKSKPVCTRPCELTTKHEKVFVPLLHPQKRKYYFTCKKFYIFVFFLVHRKTVLLIFPSISAQGITSPLETALTLMNDQTKRPLK